MSKIQSYEKKLDTNPYRQISVRTRTSRSHELSSQGWDVLRSIDAQSGTGEFMRQWLIAPASCLVLGAGVPPEHVEQGGRIPFAFGKVWATPRNLVLISEFIKNGDFVFSTEEDADKFDNESKKYSADIAEIEGEMYPEREVQVAPKAKGKGKAAEAKVPAEAATEAAAEG